MAASNGASSHQPELPGVVQDPAVVVVGPAHRDGIARPIRGRGWGEENQSPGGAAGPSHSNKDEEKSPAGEAPKPQRYSAVKKKAPKAPEVPEVCASPGLQQEAAEVEPQPVPAGPVPWIDLPEDSDPDEQPPAVVQLPGERDDAEVVLNAANPEEGAGPDQAEDVLYLSGLRAHAGFTPGRGGLGLLRIEETDDGVFVEIRTGRPPLGAAAQALPPLDPGDQEEEATLYSAAEDQDEEDEPPGKDPPPSENSTTTEESREARREGTAGPDSPHNSTFPRLRPMQSLENLGSVVPLDDTGTGRVRPGAVAIRAGRFEMQVDDTEAGLLMAIGAVVLLCLVTSGLLSLL